MGISGLLGMLKSVTYNAHLEQFAGMRAAVDTYCWLHRGTYSCSTELIMEGDSDKYVNFCLSRVDMLLRYNIEPIMIFDGGPLPMKAGKEDEREEKRRVNMERGRELLASGKSGEAAQVFSKAVDVSTNMAAKLISALRTRGVKFVVAPYEADAQLAYMSRNNLCDLVISEDSDCLPYGCKTVLFKLDKSGNGEVIDARKLVANQDLSLTHFSQDMFLDMCILSGCDYLPSIKGIGLKRAHQLVQQYKKTDRILRGIRFSNAYDVPRDYEKRFHQARMTFRHQRVYCPTREEVVSLTPLCVSTVPKPLLAKGSDGQPNDFGFLGGVVEREIAQGVANGHLDPVTKQPYPEWTKHKAGAAAADGGGGGGANDVEVEKDRTGCGEGSDEGASSYDAAEALLRGTTGGGAKHIGGSSSTRKNRGFSGRKALAPHHKQKQTLHAFMQNPGKAGSGSGSALVKTTHPAPPARSKSRNAGGLFKHFSATSDIGTNAKSLNQPAHAKALRRPFVSPIVPQKQQQQQQQQRHCGNDDGQQFYNNGMAAVAGLKQRLDGSQYNVEGTRVSFVEAAAAAAVSRSQGGMGGRGSSSMSGDREEQQEQEAESDYGGKCLNFQVVAASVASSRGGMFAESSDPNPWKKHKRGQHYQTREEEEEIVDSRPQFHAAAAGGSRQAQMSVSKGSSRFFPAAQTSVSSSSSPSRRVSSPMVPIEVQNGSARGITGNRGAGMQQWMPAALGIEQETNEIDEHKSGNDRREERLAASRSSVSGDQENVGSSSNSSVRAGVKFECAAETMLAMAVPHKMKSSLSGNGNIGNISGVRSNRAAAGGGLSRARGGGRGSNSVAAVVGLKAFAKFAFSPAAGGGEVCSLAALPVAAVHRNKLVSNVGVGVGVLRFSEARALRTSASVAFYSDSP